ncbi:O-antigen ligase family protein [Mycoplana dimorpha]|uniref:O-antigen ligase n=1 Tax=Mycoplana dimorpha TaxID=28320 RepID=A0A2T5BDV5_MYCDI|nr:O-antigen ligase family protein [Mycoplana dimorpha]PTM97184.1 O-antigen ligase [Mycoplana dimorpha]
MQSHTSGWTDDPAPAARMPSTALAKRRPRSLRASLISSKNTRLPWPVQAFLVGLVTPWIIPIGPMNLSVYRIVLLLMLLPCLFAWVRGKAGPIRFADVTVILFSLWSSLSLAIVGGPFAMIEAIGMLNIETLGAYFLARCYIRTADDFHAMVRFVCKLIIILLPFAIYESLTSHKPLLTTLALVFPTVDITTMEPRMGLWRVQGPFNHSILYGTFCGSLVVLAYAVLGYGKGGRALWLPAVMSLSAFLSLSSAPIAGLLLQWGLVGWQRALRAFRYRWALLFGILFMGYLAVEIGSNQTAVQFYISRFTFDPQTGWMRLAIWDSGTASVANHPVFGIGLGTWVRPWWMPESVDNFWLLIAMRHGIPAIILLLACYGSLLFGAAFKKGLDEREAAYRSGYVICMTVFLIVGSTVHFWAAVYVWFLFLMGSGAWILDAKLGREASGGRGGRETRASKISQAADKTGFHRPRPRSSQPSRADRTSHSPARRQGSPRQQTE